MPTIENRKIPDDTMLVREAKNNPNGWVYDIDWNYRSDAHVPSEAIRGSWRVDSRGILTGEYLKNQNYRSIVITERTPPNYMVAAAKHLSDQWMVEIDRAAEHLFPDIPEEFKVGFWYVDKSGNLTKNFRPSSRYTGRQDK